MDGLSFDRQPTIDDNLLYKTPDGRILCGKCVKKIVQSKHYCFEAVPEGAWYTYEDGCNLCGS